jgi:hypothetical protein
MTRCAQAAGAGMTATHLLMKLLANPLGRKAGKWLAILQSAGFASTYPQGVDRWVLRCCAMTHSLCRRCAHELV